MSSSLPARQPDDGDGQWGPHQEQAAYEVGEFAQGSPLRRWALARYLVGRVILERVSWSLLAVAVVLIAVAALCQFLLHTTFLVVVVVIIALVVLVLRAALRAVLRRLMQLKAYGPIEGRLEELVRGASGDVLAELRRVGLPSRLITLPMLVTRLVGRKRKETLTRMRAFEVERAVSKARLDELHVLIRQAAGAAGAPGPGPVPPAAPRRPGNMA